MFYAEQILSKNEKKTTDKPKHVVFLGKQQAIGVNGVADLEDFNHFSDMSLFVDDHAAKIRNVERSIPQSSLPWCALMDKEE